ncbi:hypothetical protein RHGRI_000773 [Rhododendron griersonianum]|uniref:Uncharacterized protein n=1 Tax=Rhododendron griersonianum TaxID=479676 RepID=A0AAV6LJ02_9ERIC|nr:hypothetical protein RHGRI_000773 [Rhododendron griersonianum]
MVEKEEEERHQAHKVTMEEAARIREEEDAKGLAYKDRGFDVGDIPYNTRASGVPVRPIDLGKFPERLVMIEKFSSFAINEFNESKKTKYQFEKVLKANGRMS